jgi:hypothetical protein
VLRFSRAALVAVALVLGLVASSTSYAARTPDLGSTDHPAVQKKKKPRPEVWKVRPSSGSVAGGTQVILRGKYFTGTRKVVFDRVPATEWEVLSDKRLRVVSPPHAEGLYRIWVTTKRGRAKPGAFDGFRYVDDTVPPPPPPLAPTIASISPDEGPIGGGTTVTITGTNFTADAEVMFGDRAATSVTVSSTTTITATSPSFPGILGGTVDVRVVTTVDTSPNTAADDFRYQGLLG